MNATEQVATILDVAVKYEEGFSDSDLAIVSDLLNNVLIRDELLSVAVTGAEQAGALIGNLCQEMVVNLPIDRVAPPATIASIIAYTWGLQAVSGAFLATALQADEEYKLAGLFAQIFERGTPPELVKELIRQALAS